MAKTESNKKIADNLTKQYILQRVTYWAKKLSIDPIFTIAVSLVEGYEVPKRFKDAAAWVDGIGDSHPMFTIYINKHFLLQHKVDKEYLDGCIVHELLHVLINQYHLAVSPTLKRPLGVERAEEILVAKLEKALVQVK